MPQPGGVGVPPASALVNFIDNHDVNRFLFRNDNVPALHAALGYLLTQDGIPCLYYGTEQQYNGGNDPSNREPLWWSGYRTDGETFTWIARLTRIRREYVALRRGGFDLRWVTDNTGDEQDAGIVAFERITPESDYALVIINTQGDNAAETSATLTGGEAMSVSVPTGTELVDALTGDPYTVAAGNTLTVTLDPYGVKILVPAIDYVPL
jgi:glycosidase